MDPVAEPLLAPSRGIGWARVQASLSAPSVTSRYGRTLGSAASLDQ